MFSVFVLLHVVFDCISSLFDCSKLSLTSSKFKCLSLELSAKKSVDCKLRFILLYMYVWFSMFISECSSVTQDDKTTSNISMAASAKTGCSIFTRIFTCQMIKLNRCNSLEGCTIPF